MMKPRNLLLLAVISAALIGPGTALAVDDPSTAATAPSTTDPTAADPTATDPSTTAPITLDQDAIDALSDQANEADDDKSVFEKASDFVTDNAPWFIIGIIVLAAIVAGILIMRGRPRKAKGAGTPSASKSNKAMRNAGGIPAEGEARQPAQVPSASELRRRKRAAIQRSREEERLRRKAGIENRKAARRPDSPVDPAVGAGAAGAAAAITAGTAAGGLDPVEAEKQGARDQEVAAGAMARFDSVQTPFTQPAPAPAQTVPAPVSPSQTAPAAGVVLPGEEPSAGSYAEPENYPEPESFDEPETYAAPGTYEPPATEAETSILHEPSLENPGADATVGTAASDFLAGAGAGAAGGFAAARAGQSDRPAEEPDEQLDPVIAPEPGMTAEHALADAEPVLPEPQAQQAIDPAPDADQRLRDKVAEIRATQEPEAGKFPPPLGPDAELSPGLAAVERKLSENSEERDRALRDAEERLRRVEQRAEDAERRAAFAERLAQLKVEESEREKRLNDVVSGIDRAEQRARDAEERAQAAERAAALALEQSDLNPPRVESSPAFARTSVPETAAAETPEAPPASSESQSAEAEETAEVPERKGLFGASSSGASADNPDTVNLNSATFEELREAGLSVTQATRILAYRERFGGYSSVDDLEKVPGFPTDLIQSLSGKISV